MLKLTVFVAVPVFNIYPSDISSDHGVLLIGYPLYSHFLNYDSINEE